MTFRPQRKRHGRNRSGQMSVSASCRGYSGLNESATAETAAGRWLVPVDLPVSIASTKAPRPKPQRAVHFWCLQVSFGCLNESATAETAAGRRHSPVARCVLRCLNESATAETAAGQARRGLQRRRRMGLNESATAETAAGSRDGECCSIGLVASTKAPRPKPQRGTRRANVCNVGGGLNESATAETAAGRESEVRKLAALQPQRKRHGRNRSGSTGSQCWNH